ncbi:MAG: hypothetical protein QNK83_13960 [Akkermansiaceae bacterium]
MKLKALIPSALVCGLMATSCGPKKKDAESDAGVSTVVDEVAEAVEAVIPAVVAEKAPEVPEISLEDLAKKTGFAQHVSADVEGYLSILDGNDLIDRILGSDLAKVIIELNGGQEALDEALGGPEVGMARAALGEEIVITVGNTAGEQGALLTSLSASRNFESMKMMVELAAITLADEPIDDMQMAGMARAMIGDPKTFIDIMEDAVMPPLTIGIKVSDADMRADLANMVEGGIAQALSLEVPFIQELVQEKFGVQLSGFTVSGEDLAGIMESQKEDVAEMIGGDLEFDRLAKAIGTKNLHVATGVYGDYILVYVGGRMEDFKLAESTKDSFLAEKDASFLKRYANKDLRLISYAEEDSLKALTKDTQAFSSILLGIKEGLEGVDVFGDTRDIQTLLQHAASSEGALMKTVSYSASGVAGFIEEGFKIEMHGGSSAPQIDFKTGHRFAGLGESDDVVLFANSASDPEFSAKILDYANSLGEAAYLMAKQSAGLEFDDGDFAEFKQSFGLFEQLAAKETAEIWDAFTTDFSEGTGGESALVIDLKGTLPKVPEVPAAIIEKGRVPRVAFVMPVTNREKVGKAWTRMNASITKLLANAAEAELFEFPMQEPIVSEKDGFSTYFFSIPTITKDANPNVSISDDLFIASSSPLFNSELSGALAKPSTVGRTGSYVKMNFKALQEFASYWVTFAKENPDDFFDGNESGKEEFLTNLPDIEKGIKAMDELKNFTAHTRMVEGEVRSTIHFKTK